jgi:pimeloyl-ACP methyl ester carboxylesterase
MPFAYNGDVRIHYQVYGEGAPLVLQHGFANSSGTWIKLGYVDAFKCTHQVITVDARGHGASDKPHQAQAYALPCFVGDVIAVLDALYIDRAHFFGYSMGGWIGFGMARYAPERLLSLIVGGHHPEGGDFSAFRDVDGQDPQRFMAALEEMVGEPLDPRLKRLMLANDLVALAALVQPRIDQRESLPELNVPCLLFAGTADKRYPALAECAQRHNCATFFALPDLNHIQTIVRADLVVPHVRSFLDQFEISSPAHRP